MPSTVSQLQWLFECAPTRSTFGSPDCKQNVMCQDRIYVNSKTCDSSIYCYRDYQRSKCLTFLWQTTGASNHNAEKFYPCEAIESKNLSKWDFRNIIVKFYRDLCIVLKKKGIKIGNFCWFGAVNNIFRSWLRDSM